MFSVGEIWCRLCSNVVMLWVVGEVKKVVVGLWVVIIGFKFCMIV